MATARSFFFVCIRHLSNNGTTFETCHGVAPIIHLRLIALSFVDTEAQNIGDVSKYILPASSSCSHTLLPSVYAYRRMRGESTIRALRSTPLLLFRRSSTQRAITQLPSLLSSLLFSSLLYFLFVYFKLQPTLKLLTGHVTSSSLSSIPHTLIY